MNRSPRNRVRPHRGLTLMELLVVVAIIGMLLAVLLPALSLVRSQAKKVRCMVNLRTVAFDFRLFADDYSYATRGDSDHRADRRFRFEDFVDSQYKIEEFWSGWPGQTQSMSAAKEPTMCPAGRPLLKRVAGKPCKAQAVTPLENVSYGFNGRLDREAVWFHGRIRMAPAYLDSGVLESGRIPIAFDIDGRTAVERDKLPYFSAPPGAIEDAYHSGEYWFPSIRHAGRMNVAFTGGHVLSSADPLREAEWAWQYQPSALRVP